MMKAGHWAASIFLAVALAASAAAAAGGDIVCEGRYDGHLQGTDAVGTNIWWSFTKTLVRTDLSGRVLASRRAPSHQGDLCVKGDTLYVAVNLGRFNTYTGGVSFVMSYDAMTLRPRKKWKLDMPYGAGGMTWRGDRFYVVGGLPPTDGRNYVHEYDCDFNLVRRHILDTGYTVLGIQTAAFIDGEFLFGIYGGEGNPKGTLRCPSDLSAYRRYVGRGSVGYAKIGGRIHTAITPRAHGAEKRWTGLLIPDDGLLADSNLYSSPWYSNGVMKKDPMRAARIALGTGRGSMHHATRDEWLAATRKLADEGFNAVIVDVADGFACPERPELAAKGAWDQTRLDEELRRLREIGLEPVPCLDFSADRCAWLGMKAGTAECLELCLLLVKDVREAFDRSRYFQVVADGWSAADREAFHDAIIANGYGCCPWPISGK